jgi:mannose-6-phosphate isomerase
VPPKGSQKNPENPPKKAPATPHWAKSAKIHFFKRRSYYVIKINNMIRIEPKCQQYAWGKVGSESLVAKLAKGGATSSFDINEEKPYAELWMGTHPSGPSMIAETSPSSSSVSSEKQLLSDYLTSNPGYVGHVPSNYTDDNLPFLLKVLSVKTALSIQAHPDKALAEELHSKFPDIYKDSNHKPEMAIALTEFEAMNGFRPLIEISNHLNYFPELVNVLGDDVTNELHRVALLCTNKSIGIWNDNKYSSSGLANIIPLTNEQQEAQTNVLKNMMNSLLNQNNDIIIENITKLIKRIENNSHSLSVEHKDRLFPHVTNVILRLYKDFPNDSGCLFPLLLNTVIMQPGEAMYLAANEPHAYICGDIVECMALSDNVVRAGLTPKFKDKDTLIRMLTYRCAEVAYCTSKTIDSNTQLFRPPYEGFPEFEVECITVDASSSHNVLVCPCATILLITKCDDNDAKFIDNENDNVIAQGDDIAFGSCYFQKANHSLRIETGKGKGKIILYRAHVNLAKF